jgi:uncharacterized protein (TIGR02284 family)
MKKEWKMAEQEKAIDVLQDLAETCRNGNKGYLQAAEHVKDHSLRTVFNEFATERASFAGELENEIIRLGDHDPDRKGTTTGALHRAWLSLKDSLGGGDGGILNSVESAEDHAKEQYEKAVNAHLPANLRDIVVRQQTRVIAAHDRVRALRDEFKQRAA